MVRYSCPASTASCLKSGHTTRPDQFKFTTFLVTSVLSSVFAIRIYLPVMYQQEQMEKLTNLNEELRSKARDDMTDFRQQLEEEFKKRCARNVPVAYFGGWMVPFVRFAQTRGWRGPLQWQAPSRDTGRCLVIGTTPVRKAVLILSNFASQLSVSRGGGGEQQPDGMLHRGGEPPPPIGLGFHRGKK